MLVLAALWAVAVITLVWWRQWSLYHASLSRHAYIPSIHDHAGAAAWAPGELATFPHVRNNG